MSNQELKLDVKEELTTEEKAIKLEEIYQKCKKRVLHMAESHIKIVIQNNETTKDEKLDSVITMMGEFYYVASGEMSQMFSDLEKYFGSRYGLESEYLLEKISSDLSELLKKYIHHFEGSMSGRHRNPIAELFVFDSPLLSRGIDVYAYSRGNVKLNAEMIKKISKSEVFSDDLLTLELILFLVNNNIVKSGEKLIIHDLLISEKILHYLSLHGIKDINKARIDKIISRIIKKIDFLSKKLNIKVFVTEESYHQKSFLIEKHGIYIPINIKQFLLYSLLSKGE